MNYTPYFEIAKLHASNDAAHDFSHVKRVYENARRILEHEQADDEIVLTAVLLHELFNYPKGHPDSKYSGDMCAEKAHEVLIEFAFPSGKIDMVLDCIRYHSFSRGVVPQHAEGKIVQDADRLDSLGAIGIARCFATCNDMARPFYHAEDPFAKDRPLNDKEFGVDHFFQKLLKLESGMHTEIARQIAAERTQFMRHYLAQFGDEIGHAWPC